MGKRRSQHTEVGPRVPLPLYILAVFSVFVLYGDIFLVEGESPVKLSKATGPVSTVS